MKFCSLCSVLKEYSFFSRKKDSPDGFATACKACRSATKKKEYESNKEHVLRRVAAYREANPEKVKAAKKNAYKKKESEYKAKGRRHYQENKAELLAYHAQYRAANRDKIVARNAKYTAANREKLVVKAKSYYEQNREAVNAYRREHFRVKRREDPLFALSGLVRRRIAIALARKEFIKSVPTEEMLGCTIEFLKVHLEAKFQDGMNWANRGEWHVDHIIPLASARTEEELIALNHYTNLQPLWAFDNLSKGAKINWQENRA